MQDILVPKLWRYISENNPDLLLTLQEEGGLTRYFQEKARLAAKLSRQMQAEMKPAYFIEEQCLNALTSDLRPSKYNYLKAVLEEEFEVHYQRLRENGTLTYEIANLIKFCGSVFEQIGFTEQTEDDPRLRYAIIGSIQVYLETTV